MSRKSSRPIVPTKRSRGSGPAARVERTANCLPSGGGEQGAERLRRTTYQGESAVADGNAIYRSR